MKHCQYCNATEQVEETQLYGPSGDTVVYACERCFTQRRPLDEWPSYTADGEKIAHE